MDEREKLKQEILEELKKQYTLIPVKNTNFSVSDIFDNYVEKICTKCDIPFTYNNVQAIKSGIKKAVALKFGVANVTVLPPNLRNAYREELEKFIKEYILGGK